MADKPVPKADDRYSEKETARRRDATIKAMIAMPPKRHELTRTKRPKSTRTTKSK